jgi:uncharacterized membrane protein
MTNNGRRTLAMNAAQGSIVVRAPVAAVYKHWLEFENYPKFITAIKRVRRLDENHFSALLALDNERYEAVLEIMLRVRERRLAWRTISNGQGRDHFAAGAVSFSSRPDQSTCVDFKLTSSFGGAISRRIDIYLHKFKALTEAGGRCGADPLRFTDEPER